MATGPWDNVQLQGPPNGPAWAQAAAQLMGAVNGAVNNSATAFRNMSDWGYQQQQRNLFQNPDNQALLQQAIQSGNYAPLVQTLMQSGGAGPAAQLIPELIKLQGQQGFYSDITGGGGNARPVNSGPASSNAAASPANIIPNFNGQQPPLSATGGDTSSGGESIQTLVASIASARGVEDVPISRMRDFAKAIGVGLDTTLSPGQEALARKVISTNLPAPSGVQGGSAPDRGGANRVSQVGADDQSSNTNHLPPSGIGGSPAVTPPQTGMRQPTRVTVRPGQAQVSPNADDGLESQSGGYRPTPIGTLKDAQAADRDADRYARAAGRMGISPEQSRAALSLSDQAKARAQEIRKQLGQYNEPSTNPNIKAGLEQFGEAGKAAGKRIGETIESGGKAARDAINTLEVMQNSLRRSGGNFATGPGAAESLKFKQAVNNIVPGFFNPQDIVDAEAITKLNAQLASSAAKAMTARPSQLEFKAFMANNPGLMQSPQGSLFLIDILRQEQEQGIKLGRLALDKRNWDNWGSVEDRFYNRPENQIHIPKQLEQIGPVQGPTGAGKRYQWSPEGGVRPM